MLVMQQFIIEWVGENRGRKQSFKYKIAAFHLPSIPPFSDLTDLKAQPQ